MSPARRDGVARKEALLDAALRCFNERGVLATGIEEIRREAGASPSSVYHLFDGVAGLTSALLLRTFERLFAHLTGRVAEADTAEGCVKALVGGHLEWVATHRDEARFMYQATALEMDPAAAAALLARKQELLAPMLKHVGRFVARGELPRWPPELLDVVLLGPSHEASRRWLGGGPVDPRWMRKHLPELAWQSVRPPGKRSRPRTKSRAPAVDSRRARR